MKSLLVIFFVSMSLPWMIRTLEQLHYQQLATNALIKQIEKQYVLALVKHFGKTWLTNARNEGLSLPLKQRMILDTGLPINIVISFEMVDERFWMVVDSATKRWSTSTRIEL